MFLEEENVAVGSASETPVEETSAAEAGAEAGETPTVVEE